ncbi:MAG: hypothetical protein JSV80_00490 [Acidobacteriota bacterium]|nr:MAG: hypothetical protein JSV80_00490 [Acidobacteriota bacterium]
MARVLLSTAARLGAERPGDLPWQRATADGRTADIEDLLLGAQPPCGPKMLFPSIIGAVPLDGLGLLALAAFGLSCALLGAALAVAVAGARARRRQARAPSPRPPDRRGRNEATGPAPSDRAQPALASQPPAPAPPAMVAPLLEGFSQPALILVDQYVAEANAAALHRLGPELCGRRFADLLPAEQLLRALQFVRRAARGETVPPLDCTLLPEGPDVPDARTVRARVAALPIAHAGTAGVLLLLIESGRPAAFARRASRSHRTSDPHRRRQTVGREDHTMDTVHHPIAEPLARAEMFTCLSHELTSPLTSIRGYVQMLLQERLGQINDDQRHGLSVALRNVDRAVDLIDRLLILVRAEEGEIFNPQAQNAGPILREIFERHEARATARGLRFEIDDQLPDLKLSVHEDGLTVVLDNLVSNAIKFTPSGGSVRLRLSEDASGFARLEVRDTGPGIPSAERKRVFELFYRGRQARDTRGAGIGLATVSRIVSRHGGRIRLDSTPGRGTRFDVLWPLAAAQPPRQEEGGGASSSTSRNALP